MDLYSKVCNKLRYWVFPELWPTKPVDLLTFTHVEILKFLPYISAFTNMCKFREDLANHTYQSNVDFKWLTTDLSLLTRRISAWLEKMPRLEQIYYGSYTSTNRRLTQIFDFTPEAIITNFGLKAQKGGDLLNYMRIFATFIGNPLATVEQREVKNKIATVLCIPKEVLSYGI